MKFKYMKKEIIQQMFEGERALFKSNDLKLIDCIFHDGESPLKESHNIELNFLHQNT